MKPVPLSAFIPPVTGTGGRPGNVNANSFDSSNLFPYPRPRANSKRMRTDDDIELNRRFDLTRDFPPLLFPEKQGIDVDAVSALLVGAAAAVPGIKARMESPEAGQDVKELASFGLKMFELVECLWEKVVKPAAACQPAGQAAGAAAPRTLPKPDLAKRELIEALAASDRTAILYDANLGNIPIANRQKLCHSLSAGLRESAIAMAALHKTDPSEAIRVADDALSLVSNMSFMGQASKPVKDGTHCSMPIKLEFEDRGARIHFERTVKERCGIRATMSLPYNVREAQKKFHATMRDLYEGEIIMVRVDTEKLRFVAFHKFDQGPKWNPCFEYEDIPHDILSRDMGPPARVAFPPVPPEGAAGGVAVGGSGDVPME